MKAHDHHRSRTHAVHREGDAARGAVHRVVGAEKVAPRTWGWRLDLVAARRDCGICQRPHATDTGTQVVDRDDRCSVCWMVQQQTWNRSIPATPLPSQGMPPHPRHQSQEPGGPIREAAWQQHAGQRNVQEQSNSRLSPSQNELVAERRARSRAVGAEGPFGGRVVGGGILVPELAL